MPRKPEPPKLKPDRKIALVTGATAGIGAEFVTILARDQYDVVLVSHDAKRVEAAAEGIRKALDIKTWAITQDLSQPGAAAAIIAQLEAQELRVHTLINNAAVGMAGAFAKSNLAEQLAILNVNVVALSELTHRLLPRMIALQEGRILNVASTAALIPGPNMAVYYASKAYVLSFTEALWYELRKTKIHVSCLCPGSVQTEFAERAKLRDASLLRRFRSTNVQKIAQAGYDGLKKRKRVVVAGSFANFSVGAIGWLPRKTVMGIVARSSSVGEGED